jgi:DNA modification methylase
MDSPLTIVRVPISQLHADPGNANTHDERNLRTIRDSLREFGQVEPLVVQKGTGRVIGGNGRLEVMRDEGVHEVDVVEFEGSEVQARALAIALNRTAKTSVFDDTILAEQLRALQSEDFPIAGAGFTDAEVDALLQSLGDEALGGNGEVVQDEPPPLDKAAELQEKWGTAAGQLWVVPSLTSAGRSHRLLCGDCTKTEDVERLMDGAKAQGAFTSPPYAEQRKSQYGGTPADQYVAWWEAVQAGVRAILSPDGSFFVNIKAHSEGGERSLYVMDLVLAMRRRWAWRYIDEFCWRNTRNGVPGTWPNRLKNAWEPIHHFDIGGCKVRRENIGYESDAAFRYSPDNARSASRSGLLGCEKASGYETADALPSNVIEVAAQAGMVEHSAPFPIDLPTFFLEAFSDPGDLWFEPFAGSGTTLVAAEQSSRLCNGLEIHPPYVAVTLERLSNLGLDPQLEV